jgi:hypothetical protein
MSHQDIKKEKTLSLRGFQKEEEKGIENSPDKAIAGNFPNLGKDTVIQVQEDPKRLH